MKHHLLDLSQGVSGLLGERSATMQYWGLFFLRSFLFFFGTFSRSVTQTAVQWRSLGSPSPVNYFPLPYRIALFSTVHIHTSQRRLFPISRCCIYIPRIRYPYIKQVFQDVSVPPRLFHIECLLCFSMFLSATDCQPTSVRVYSV